MKDSSRNHDSGCENAIQYIVLNGPVAVEVLMEMFDLDRQQAEEVLDTAKPWVIADFDEKACRDAIKDQQVNEPPF